MSAPTFTTVSQTRYAWPLWEDGEEHKLTRGVDYPAAQNLIGAAHRRTRFSGLRMTSKQVDGGAAMLVRFVPRWSQ
jgi:hypothetical protein